MQRSLCLCHKLLRSSTQNYCCSRCFWTACEQIVSLPTDALLLKQFTGAQDIVTDSVHCSLHSASHGTLHTLKVLFGNSTRAEDVSVCKVLGGQISNCQSAQDNLCSCGDDLLEFIVDNIPLGIDDCLILFGRCNSDLCVLLLRLELQFNIQQNDLWIYKLLRLLLKARVGKGLLKSHTLHEHRVHNATTLHFLDSDQSQIKILVQRENRIRHHAAKKVLVVRH
mmetsp:Transcript_11729/g.35738  ORF Transcript_11729/g.35738 Transcript_11729/m.35738 type:complete len:224 (-) Transcript_11729:664-1335(-)